MTWTLRYGWIAVVAIALALALLGGARAVYAQTPTLENVYRHGTTTLEYRGWPGASAFAAPRDALPGEVVIRIRETIAVACTDPEYRPVKMPDGTYTYGNGAVITLSVYCAKNVDRCEAWSKLPEDGGSKTGDVVCAKP